MKSTVRPGVISVYSDDTNAVSRQIFVAGGFAEVTGERCTVLAEEAVAVADLDAGAAKDRLSAAESAMGSAESDSEKNAAARELAIASAMVAAAA